METNTENLITITPRITANPPVLQDIEVTENGEYTADGSADGIGTVIVNVEPNNEEITITENGEYTPSEEYDGISKVNVDVHPDINLEELNITENGEYTPSEEYDGISKVNVDVVIPKLEPVISYSDNVISWNIGNDNLNVYSSVFVNDINIYNGYSTSCKASNKIYGNNVIKVNVFDVNSLLTGAETKTVFISNARLYITLENSQSIFSLKFDDVETIYVEGMEIPNNVQSVKIIVSKIDETYNQESRSQVYYRNFEYEFVQDIGVIYNMKPYNVPILSGLDRVSATECKTADNKFIVKTDSEWDEREGSAYKMFDTNTYTFWNSLRTDFPHYIEIFTTESMCIKSLFMRCRNGYSNEFPKRFVLQGSNDGETYTDICEINNNIQPSSTDDIITFNINNENYYNYYKINVYSTFGYTSTTGAVSLSELSFIALRE